MSRRVDWFWPIRQSKTNTKNHPTLWQDIHTFFTDPQAEADEWKQDHTWNKGHGRLEERRIWTTTLLNPPFERQWAGAAQVFVIRRRITHRLTCSQQIVYGITSLTPQRAEPKRLLELERTHWPIEIVPIIAVMSLWAKMLPNLVPRAHPWPLLLLMERCSL